MKVIERIYKYIEYKGIKAVPFEKKIGLSNGYLGKQLRRNADLGESIIMKIIENCPEISPEWLLTGKGDMLKGKDIMQPAESNQGIPLIPFDAMAGWGNNDGSAVMDYEIDRYIVPDFTELHVDYMIRVKGDSMHPKYDSGDIIACKKLPLDTFFQWNKVYVLDTIQGPMIKRINPSDIDKHVLLCSDNDQYKPFDLHIEEIHSLAIVVGVIRLE